MQLCASRGAIQPDASVASHAKPLAKLRVWGLS